MILGWITNIMTNAPMTTGGMMENVVQKFVYQ